MKLILVCSSIGGGGAERVAVNLANSFVSSGHEVAIFLRRRVSNPYTLDGRVKTYFSKKEGFLYSILSLRKVFLSGGFDAVISFTDVSNILTFLSVKTVSRDIVYIPTIHTNLIERNSRYTAGVRLATIRYLHKLSCDFADKVVTVSKGGGNAVLSLYDLPELKVKVIYNPVLFDSDIFFNRNSIGLVKKGAVKLVAAGRLTKAKNYYLMIDAVKILNSVSGDRFYLDIYGEGEIFQSLKSYVSYNDLQEYILFKGFVSNLREKLFLYDIFLFSSDWEGFGNVLVEALSVGLSVVSTDCPSGPSEILNDGEFGKLVKVGDVDGFVNAILDEVDDPLKIDMESLHLHLEKFRESVVAKQYISLIGNILTRNALD